VFPTDIGYSSRGGPGYNTTIVVNSAGIETRNQNWSQSRGEWDIAYGIKTQERLENLINFFHVAAGRANTFLFKNPLDYKSTEYTDDAITATDQAIGTGTGALTTFQLVKVYNQSGYTRSKTIYKPKAGTVRVAVAGVEKSLTTHFTVNTVTGVITFTAGNIPTAGQAVTAGFEYYVPVRFDVDAISASLDDYQAGRISVPLVEVKTAD
jgi:uncharacterized protein (TIGR02217 family)